MEILKINLTEYTKGGGCGCKIPQEELKTILRNQYASEDLQLLVGNSSSDDAAVYDLGNGSCLISTIDFFTPIVDDPFDFGRVAAANALSDVYAMGGKPILALSFLAWPTDKLSGEIAESVINGARFVCEEANISIAGGHSIVNPEPIFGLSVNGFIEKDQIKRNNSIESGDVLILTKPLGSGILTTAKKRRILDDKYYSDLIQHLTKLNKVGAELGKLSEVHAMTDITGFGLIGHLLEMIGNKDLSVEIEYSKIPLMNGVTELAAQFVYPDNTMRNWRAYSDRVEGINGESLLTLNDPQTNGGLLIAVDKSVVSEVQDLLASHNLCNEIIGTIGSFKGKSILVN